jgi:ELWxxDGT repeat protein
MQQIKAQTPEGLDIIPGFASSNPSSFVKVDETLYFNVNSPLSGTALWKSDGTPNGTVIVREGIILNPVEAIDFNGTLFFAYDDQINGNELWKTDGTDAGTVLVKDIRPGMSAYAIPYGSNPESFVVFENMLYFSATDFAGDYELWKTDGTETGTVRVKDINPGTNGSNVSVPLVANGILFFQAYDDVNGTELWRSDGTEQGTVMVKDINPGAVSSTPSGFVNVNETLFFQARDLNFGQELWKSDGTEAGTVLVKDINPGYGLSLDYTFSHVVLDGILYFDANNGTNGRELWRSDGTNNGTTMVKDIRSGSTSSGLTEFTEMDGLLFFSAADDVSGEELWRSDGTEAGTVMVKDINPTFSSIPRHLANFNGTIYFSADDGVNGFELWKSDGTEEGTLMIDIGTGQSSPYALSVVNEILFFGARDDQGVELWKLGEAGTLGTQEQLRTSIKLYPNPVQDYLNVDWENFDRASITDLSGKELLKSIHARLDLRTLNNGVYLITLSGKNKELRTFRFIKV